MAAAVIVSKGNQARRAMSVVKRSNLLQLPPLEDRLRSGVVQKRVVTAEGVWHHRQLVLTNEMLCVSREDSIDILDQIPLASISSISASKKSHSFFRTESQASGASDKRTASFGKPDTANKEVGSPPQGLAASKLNFEVATRKDSAHRGRTFYFRAKTVSDCHDWCTEVTEACKKAQRHADMRDRWTKTQATVRMCYESLIAQGVVASLIIANFAVAIVEAQLVPEEGSALAKRLEVCELLFTGLFAVELAINMFSLWFFRFWHDGWNIFDFVIVMVSLVSIPLDHVPGFTQVRLLRVFRVARIFELMASLRKIIMALSASVIPVINAFLVLALVTCIYAIVGVSVFNKKNPEMFGNFSAALFTMFQVCTGDGWAMSIARPMFRSKPDPDPVVSVFFLSYILVVGTFLLNVVIAVLLDEFITAVQTEKARKRAYKEDQASREDETALDPLLATLSTFNTPNDLRDKIRSIYKVLDSDDSGGLSFEEMRDGMLRLEPPITLTAEDFEYLLEAGDQHTRELSLEDFEACMRAHLTMYVQRHMAKRMMHAQEQDANLAAVMVAVKMLGLQVAQVAETKGARALPHSPGGGKGLEAEVAALHSKLDLVLSALNPAASSASTRLHSRTASARSTGWGRVAEQGEGGGWVGDEKEDGSVGVVRGGRGSPPTLLGRRTATGKGSRPGLVEGTKLSLTSDLVLCLPGADAPGSGNATPIPLPSTRSAQPRAAEESGSEGGMSGTSEGSAVVSLERISPDLGLLAPERTWAVYGSGKAEAGQTGGGDGGQKVREGRVREAGKGGRQGSGSGVEVRDRGGGKGVGKSEGSTPQGDAGGPGQALRGGAVERRGGGAKMEGGEGRARSVDAEGEGGRATEAGVGEEAEGEGGRGPRPGLGEALLAVEALLTVEGGEHGAARGEGAPSPKGVGHTPPRSPGSGRQTPPRSPGSGRLRPLSVGVRRSLKDEDAVWLAPDDGAT